MPSVAEENDRPFRLGVWCDYGFTLAPTCGIGVFVYNLLAGLLELNESFEVVLLVRSRDRKVAAPLWPRAQGRLRVIPDYPQWLSISAWCAFAMACMDFCLRFGQTIRHRIAILQLAIQQTSGRLLNDAGADLQRNRKWRACLGRLGLAFGFGFFWAAETGCQLTKGMVRIILFPLWLVAKVFRRWAPKRKSSLDWAVEADCDMWMIPYLGLDSALSFPSVLFIHDLVPNHFPHLFPREVVDRVHRLAFARSAEATLCACMSGFIRDVDLYGVLGLPAWKVRMIRPAPPSDFPAPTQQRPASLKRAFLNRPFLLMPAGIRGHKNQANLITALATLRDRYGENGLNLLLTGESKGGLTADLKHLIQECGLEGRVHFLGLVPREELASLYQGAFATIMPSLYEQGSFPIHEALHWGCPVACSDIPPLREQCEAMGEAMLYFDPLDPDAIARAILRIRDDRQSIRARQYAASRVLWQRTWKDVAREWLAVFKEAAEMGRGSISTKNKGKSAA
jgi:glycosyltransferase involved in cell wall biosynthesis